MFIRNASWLAVYDTAVSRTHSQKRYFMLAKTTFCVCKSYRGETTNLEYVGYILRKEVKHLQNIDVWGIDSFFVADLCFVW